MSEAGGAWALGDYLASVPWNLGYYPDENYVHVFSAAGAQMDQRSLDVYWPQGLDPAAGGPRIAREITKRLDSPGTVVGVVGYGEHGAELVDAMQPTLTDGGARAVLVAHVDEEHFRVRAAGLDWSDFRPMPAVPVEVATAGYAIPARDRQEHVARYAPLPEPAFTLPERAETERLARMSPSQRAQLGRELLDNLSTEHVQLDHDSMRTLAYLVNATPLAVRDAVLVHAAKSHERAGALLETYRAAPPDLRGHLGASAAAALNCNDVSNSRVRAVLEHVSDDIRLGQLVKQAMDGDLPLRNALERMEQATEVQLNQLDTEHAAQKAAELRGHSPAPGVRETQAGPEHPGSPATGADGPQIER